MKTEKKGYRLLIGILISVIILGTLVIAGFFVLQLLGRNSLYGRYDGKAPNLNQAMVKASGDALEAETEGAEYIWQEGDVRYQGDIYRYNEDILTFLFLGIDCDEEVEVKKEGIEGGQSDALFLLVLNPHNKEVSVIAINRNTMTDIDVYDEYGDYLATVKGQITLQHGYGDGAQISCERSREVVSRLFYDLPIHGYCSINMGAIPIMNDMVGGVEVTVLEDMGSLKTGETALLQGKMAYDYVRYRDADSFGSANRRLERQKQYLAAYADVAREVTNKDITFPVKLYNTLSKYVVTDITIDELSYLATRVLDYKLTPENFYSCQGETVVAGQFEEFYVDEKTLYELVLEVFYEKVSN